MLLLACDIVSLCAQAVGGCIAAFTPIKIGTSVLVAGLLIHVAGLITFSACSLEFLWRARKHQEWQAR